MYMEVFCKLQSNTCINYHYPGYSIPKQSEQKVICINSFTNKGSFYNSILSPSVWFYTFNSICSILDCP